MRHQWNLSDEDLETYGPLTYEAGKLKGGLDDTTNLDEDEDDMPPSQGG